MNNTINKPMDKKKPTSKITHTFLLLLALATTITAGSFISAYGFGSYLSQFNTEYGTTGTPLDSCDVCHVPGQSKSVQNAYGTDWANAGYVFADIEQLDSDGDGFDNITEIVELTFPGDPGSTPTPTNASPIADAGPDQTVDVGVLVTLDGSNSSDPDDGIASYLWEQTGGPAVTLSDPTAVQPTFTAPDLVAGGTALTFQLIVTDNGGLQSTDTCIVNLSGENAPPTANPGFDQTADEGETVTLDGSGSIDPDDGIGSYKWKQKDAKEADVLITLSDPTASNPTFVAPPIDADETELAFELTVTDHEGLKDSNEVSVTINDNGITGFPADALTMTSATGENIGIKVESGGNCTSLNAIDPSTISDAINTPSDLIYGLIDMEIKVDAPGGTAEVSVYLPTPAPEGFRWFKYSSTRGWYDYSANAVFNAARDKVTLTLIDGGVGDDDGLANGVIVDPSGLGTDPVGGATASPTSSGGGGGCFITTAGLGSLY